MNMIDEKHSFEVQANGMMLISHKLVAIELLQSY